MIEILLKALVIGTLASLVIAALHYLRARRPVFYPNFLIVWISASLAALILELIRLKMAIH